MSSEKEIAVITRLIRNNISVNELCHLYDMLFQQFLDQKAKLLTGEEKWFLYQIIPNISQNIPLSSLSLKDNWELNEEYPLTPAILGDFFESQTSEDNRIKGGKVFTPMKIANAMVYMGLDAWFNAQYHEYITLNELNRLGIDESDPRFIWKNLKTRFEAWTTTEFDFPAEKLNFIITLGSNILNFLLCRCFIMEPCVGSGVFLLAVCREIFQLFRIFYPYLWFQEKINRQVLDPLNYAPKILFKEIISMDFEMFSYSMVQFILRFIEKNVVLLDLSSDALRICGIRIKALLLTTFGIKIPSGIPKILHLRLKSIAANALKGAWFCQDKPPSFVIGNPPYISSDSMAKYFSPTEILEMKNAFRSVIKLGSKPDMFFYFIKKALDEMQTNGILTFIIPNRILINDYAYNLRQYIFENAQILKLIDFSPDTMVFQNANVHPCILIIQKRDNRLNNTNNMCLREYLASYLDTKPMSEYWEDSELHYTAIPNSLAKHYNLLFSHLNHLNIQILHILQKFPRLGDVMTIREATRTARFQHFFPKDFSLHISREEYETLSEEDRKPYIAECRGQDIHNYYIVIPTSYIAIPELYKKQIDSTSKPPKLLETAKTPKVLIRELGKRIFIGFHPGVPAILPYGGVYYFTSAEIREFQIKPIRYNLEAKMAYLASNVTLYIFSFLFHAGAWGDALKFRSSYLHQLPYIDQDVELMGVFGHQIYIFSRLKYQLSIHQPDSPFISQLDQLVEWINTHIDLILITYIISEQLEPGLKLTELEFLRNKLTVPFLNFPEFENKLQIDSEPPNYLSQYSLLESYLQLFQEITQEIISDSKYQIITAKIRQHPLYQMINNLDKKNP